MKESKLKELPEVFEEAAMKQNLKLQQGKYRVTANMLLIVYTEVILNIPLNSHESLVRLIELIGGNVGIHHYEVTSAIKMAKFIREELNITIIPRLTFTVVDLYLSPSWYIFMIHIFFSFSVSS